MSHEPDIDQAAIDALLGNALGAVSPMTPHSTPNRTYTQANQLRRGSETFYVRAAEDADENLETDAEAPGTRTQGIRPRARSRRTLRCTGCQQRLATTGRGAAW